MNVRDVLPDRSLSDISSTLESRIERLCVSHSFMYRCTTSLAIVTSLIVSPGGPPGVRKLPAARKVSAYQTAERDVFPGDLTRPQSPSAAVPSPRRDVAKGARRIVGALRNGVAAAGVALGRSASGWRSGRCFPASI